MGRNFAKLVLFVEGVLLAAMLLADFGIIASSVDPLSSKSIMLHITVVILIIASVVGIKKSGSK